MLDSGSVTSVGGRHVLFNISGIKVRVVFKEAEDDKQSMEFHVISNNELQISLQNFNNPLGTEFTNAIKIGTYNGKSLLLHLKVLGMHNSKNRTIIYTWLLDEVENGR